MIANISELEREQVAGAMNIWAKMEATIVGGRSVAELVKKITRINQDRIWFEPNVDLLAAVSDSTTGADFRRASATLHALPGYRLLESFKTEELYGNLQLTFLESKDRPGDILVDADIDEASGVMHLFQVLRNTLTKGETHPYDIHEILEFHQELDTGYQLIV
ncbi:MAG: hypothetical protein GY906_08635 [bacterium]|nr:hypothetical protein [bacterium]